VVLRRASNAHGHDPYPVSQLVSSALASWAFARPCVVLRRASNAHGHDPYPVSQLNLQTALPRFLLHNRVLRANVIQQPLQPICVWNSWQRAVYPLFQSALQKAGQFSPQSYMY